MVGRAGEIFGAEPERMSPKDAKRWLTLGEAVEKDREQAIKSSQFVWNKRNGRLFASVEGRPKSRCPKCMMEVYRGVLASGRQVLVTKQGLWHQHG